MNEEREMTDSPPTCFFAYPSQPKSRAEAIESALELIEGTGAVATIGWKSLSVAGKIVIDQICHAIDESDMFVCDLSDLNPNVLFEFGYAVAKNKRVWLTLDTSYPQSMENYRHFKMLTSIGYAEYRNSREIINAFLDDQPFNDLENSLLSSFQETMAQSATPTSPTLLYLKSPIESEASTRLTVRLQASPITLITDDPAEVSFQSLAWYIENVKYAQALIVHLLDDERAEGFLLQNSKDSFIAGLAHGLGTNLLMLAHSPFDPPFDYQDLLHTHTSASECISIAEGWLPSIEREFISRRKRLQERRTEVDSALALRGIHLGDYIAENERSELMNYFVVTAPFTEALRAEQTMLYVGQKGSGKTANLFKVADELGRDKRNHVCILKPVDYDVEGVINLLHHTIPMSQKGYLIESLWKYLIYSQLAVGVYEMIMDRPLHIGRTQDEEEFVSSYESKRDLLEPDFSIRLDNALRELTKIDNSGAATRQRSRVSELLHETELAQLRTQLGVLLEDKNRVCVLIDNLDKAWRPREELSLLSDFIFGLLGVAASISDEFARSGPSWRSVDLSIVIFLRSDIFSYLMDQAREVDKVPYRRIDWKDKELLLRVVEERFNKSIGREISPDEIWTGLFVEEVRGIPTRDYITSKIIPRPRDIIFFCKACLSFSINRFHSRIEVEDILQAESEYSHFAYLALVSEVKPRVNEIEELILEFAGADEVVEQERIESFVEKAGMDRGRTAEVISILTDAFFLGREVAANEFRFLYDDSRRNIINSLAEKASKKLGAARFRINDPFHAYLEIRTSGSASPS